MDYIDQVVYGNRIANEAIRQGLIREWESFRHVKISLYSLILFLLSTSLNFYPIKNVFGLYYFNINTDPNDQNLYETYFL